MTKKDLVSILYVVAGWFIAYQLFSEDLPNWVEACGFTTAVWAIILGDKHSQ